jgi:hypothetical protein
VPPVLSQRSAFGGHLGNPTSSTRKRKNADQGTTPDRRNKEHLQWIITLTYTLIAGIPSTARWSISTTCLNTKKPSCFRYRRCQTSSYIRVAKGQVRRHTIQRIPSITRGGIQ